MSKNLWADRLEGENLIIKAEVKTQVSGKYKVTLVYSTNGRHCRAAATGYCLEEVEERARMKLTRIING